MTLAAIDALKREWTGQRVAVVGTAGRLRRFKDQTGTVVTINMNGRALVQFDGDADIGWYDIAPADLRKVVAAEPQSEWPAEANHSDAPPSPATPTPKPLPPGATATGKREKPTPSSILELARRQGAAKPPSQQ